MDITFFSLSLTLISSAQILLAHFFLYKSKSYLYRFKITSSFLSTLIKILFALKKLLKCFISPLGRLDFLLTYLHEKDLYLQESDTLCSNELPYGDHSYKLRKIVVLEQNIVIHNNLLALSQIYIH